MAYCAVKIVRAVPKYKKAAELEVSVLLQLQGQHGCVRLLRHFEYQGHICMSFELLGPNLYEIMRACNFRPFEISHIRRIAAQVCDGSPWPPLPTLRATTQQCAAWICIYIHVCTHTLSAIASELLKDRCGAQVVESLCLVHGRAIVHTDVKPENVLLVDQVAVLAARSPRPACGAVVARPACGAVVACACRFSVKSDLAQRRQMCLTLGAPGQVHKKGLVLQERGLALQQLNVKLVDFGSAVHRSVLSACLLPRELRACCRSAGRVWQR